MSKPAAVAIYARVSTSEQNPEAQLLAWREYALAVLANRQYIASILGFGHG
jgi:DNA invertase Pin-like site-specific DNA recombinase